MWSGKAGDIYPAPFFDHTTLPCLAQVWVFMHLDISPANVD